MPRQARGLYLHLGQLPKVGEPRFEGAREAPPCKKDRDGDGKRNKLNLDRYII